MFDPGFLDPEEMCATELPDNISSDQQPNSSHAPKHEIQNPYLRSNSKTLHAAPFPPPRYTKNTMDRCASLSNLSAKMERTMKRHNSQPYLPTTTNTYPQQQNSQRPIFPTQISSNHLTTASYVNRSTYTPSQSMPPSHRKSSQNFQQNENGLRSRSYTVPINESAITNNNLNRSFSSSASVNIPTTSTGGNLHPSQRMMGSTVPNINSGLRSASFVPIRAESINHPQSTTTFVPTTIDDGPPLTSSSIPSFQEFTTKRLPHGNDSHICLEWANKKWNNLVNLESEKLNQQAYDAQQRLFDMMDQHKSRLTRECDVEVDQNVQQIEMIGEEYLRAHNHNMDTNTKMTFIDDFRRSVEQIRVRIKKQYEQKVHQIQTSYNLKIDEEIQLLKTRIGGCYRKQLETFSKQMATEKLQRLTNIREQLLQENQIQLENFVQTESCKSEEDLIRYESNLKHQTTQSLCKLRKELEEKYARKKKGIWKKVADEQDKQINEIKEDFTRYLKEAEDDAYNSFQNDILEFRKKMQTEYDGRKNKIVSEFKNKLEDEKNDLKEELQNLNDGLEERERRNLENEYNGVMENLRKEMETKATRIRKNADRGFENQRRTLELKRDAALRELEEECVIEFEQRIVDLKCKIREQYELKQTSILNTMKNEERKRYENEIQNLRKELDEDTKKTIDTCRNQLKRILISEINTERENIIKQKQITIAKIKTLFESEKKEWMQKILGAAELDKQQSIVKIKQQLQKEQRESIKQLKIRIQTDKLQHIKNIKHQYEQEKREKLKCIAKQYLSDPNFPESRALLSFKEEMEEELSLIDRFHAFSKRIQDLQQEILYLRQVNKNEV